MKAYIKIDVTKELPGINMFESLELTKDFPEWWLKEINLSPLICEFTRSIGKYYAQGYSVESVLSEFLAQKGIVIKD